MSKKGALETKGLAAVITKMLQSNAEKIWLETKNLEQDVQETKPKSGGKLGMIEDQLGHIVSDVKNNINAIASRGKNFDELQKKSDELSNHVSEKVKMTIFLVVCDEKEGKVGETAERERKFIAGNGPLRMPDNYVHDDVCCHMKLSDLIQS